MSFFEWFKRAVSVYFHIRMLWNDLRYIIRLSTVNLRWKKRNLLISIIIISVWPNAMAGTASPWWDVWCQVAVMMLPLSAGCPGLGQSVLSGAESLQESVLKRKTGNLLQNPSMISQCLVPCQSETVLWDKLTLWNSSIFSGMRSSTAAARRSTNSPSAWGFSFLAISSLTTMKLACVTLSWSARGLDKTAWQLYPRALVLSTHTVLHVSRYNDAQGLSFHYCRSVPTNQAHGLAFHF